MPLERNSWLGRRWAHVNFILRFVIALKAERDISKHVLNIVGLFRIRKISANANQRLAEVCLFVLWSFRLDIRKLSASFC